MKQYLLGWREAVRARIADWRRARPRRLTVLAWGAIAFERFLRAFFPVLIVVAFFVALSWTGIWLGAPSFLRILGVSALIGALVASLIGLRAFVWPRAGEARDALDAGDPTAPAAALADNLANSGDPQTQSLWRLHQRRAEKRAARLRLVLPAPRLWSADPYAIGALAVLALFATGLLAGPEKYARVAAAFDWRWRPAHSAPSRIDAWIDPPPYTGRPPIVLPLRTKSEGGGAISAPVGSSIIIRAVNAGDLRIVAQGGVEAAKPAATHDAASKDRRFLLRGDGRLSLGLGAGEIASLALKAIPDLPPKITPIAAPKTNLRGSFELRYRIEDDYGAHDAELSAKLVSGQTSLNAHPLVQPPKGSLELPTGPGALGEGATIVDWSDSPYAGARVDLTLAVHDDAGNEGRATIKNYVLPGKIFRNPLALALVEQRRILALDAWQRDRVLTAIDALTMSPELFMPNLGVYLGLRFAHDSLRHARNDADLTAVVDLLWNMALRIEEGDVPQAERDLKAAEQALRDALKKGASQQEIARLTEQLQKALDRYLAAMQERAAKQSKADEMTPGDQRLVTPKDFKSMLDQMAEAARQGDKDAAMRMLDRLQDMLENLREARQSKGASEAARNRRMMRDIDNMMREQQKLRDDTYARDRENDGQSDSQERGEKPASPERQGETSQGQNDQALQNELARRQERLREKLDSLRGQAEGAARGKSKGLAEAAEAMRQAENALKNGDAASATGAQGRALEGLRKGAAEAAAAQGEGNGQGDGQEAGQKNGQGFKGRNSEGRFGSANRQNNVDATTAQRARKVLEELRRRLSDPNRAREELDYLERLIRPD
ncbi:TIGR02302 family protein [Rhodoblastus acidophilus]|uniref:TIGR02302 family protein n=1 Tax=Candidatus Rhodoblastus alkanivorans TaxID=2954117 RepID=A0ABS9Z2K9_9HYPH|nr:TIGR02302 family protein [Candidatus Rhodoblastus alkanivorans]MCI4681422.1 TIGR02302 family protein [Candidatus Rhodoblastus alkanivorans]MDI4642470.1 TIGR02302 family protein [Rhodoblastus acidophilus]